MLGPTIKAIGLAIDKWWYKLFMLVVLCYCLWLFAATVDAYFTDQMNLWSSNLGM